MLSLNYCFLIPSSQVHPSYKTRLCWNYPFCSRGGDCNFIHQEEERRGGIKEVSFEVENSGRKDGKSKDEWSFGYGPKLDVPATKLVMVKKGEMRSIDELDNHMKDLLKSRIQKV